MEWRPPPVPVPHSLHPNDHYWLRRPIPSGRVDWGLDWYPYGGNGSGQWRVHHGMDFPNNPGTPVLAAGDGVVILIRDSWTPATTMIDKLDKVGDATPTSSLTPESEITPTLSLTQESIITPTQILAGAYGNYVVIRHDWGWQGKTVYTLYGHLLEIFVGVGDHVAAGDLIAGVGNTGDSTGPHLHFEVRVDKNHYNSTRNPALWIAPYEEWGTLAGQITNPEGAYIQNAVLSISPLNDNGAIDPNDDQTRTTTSYSSYQVNPDDLWNENFCFPDLQAGFYRVKTKIGQETLQADVEIRPGVTTMIKLHTRLEETATPTPTATSTPNSEIDQSD
ncbi:MAG: peptidoglycan DD-metalloendopeptidase family protein [Anaerolineales bacterium]|nr:peptidoglycan DD-metalloendopeptidase family protein [Anaerolineales bacterium]